MTLDRQLVVRALPGYDVGDEIGRGGWSLVLSATHRNLDRPVAVKVLPRAFAADPRVRARFHDEARIVASLHHPHVVPVLDFVEQDGLCLVVMERMQRGTLWDRFVANGVRLDHACAFGLAATAALAHAHDHDVVHRDVKPENLLFSADDVLQLSDFGIAKVLGHGGPSLTVTGAALGTPAYMSPEQVLGQPVGAATDVYATGVLLYELACGVVPYADAPDATEQLAARTQHPAPPLRDRRPDVHPALAAVIDWCLARSPAERPASMHDLAHALANAATEAFGPGWLRGTGVTVMAPLDVLARTEHPVASSHPVMADVHVTRSHAPHDRLGAVPTEPVAPGPPPGAERPSAPPPPPPPPTGAGPRDAGPTGHHPDPPTPTTPPAPPTPAGRRRRSAVPVLVALAALVLVGGVVAVAIGIRRSAPPRIGAVDTTTRGISIDWSDGDTGGHLLLAYSSAGSQELPLDFSPREVLVPDGERWCFVVARAGDRTIRSSPACINGADPAVLVRN